MGSLGHHFMVEEVWVAQNPWLMMSEHYSDNDAYGENDDDINVLVTTNILL